jgi:hypothetical protein
MEELDTRTLVLDISSNLSRLGRFALQNNKRRIRQFLLETGEYLRVLNSRKVPLKFCKTLEIFNNVFNDLKSTKKIDKFWADDAFTYSNILMHRSKFLIVKND